MAEKKGNGFEPVEIVIRMPCTFVPNVLYSRRKKEASRTKAHRGCSKCVVGGQCRILGDCEIDAEMMPMEKFWAGVEMRPTSG